MTPAQTRYRKTLIRQVHTSARYVNYYRDRPPAYRAMLLKHFGRSSSADLSLTRLVQLRDYMHLDAALPEIEHATPRQIYKITQLWEAKARDTSESAMLRFASRIAKEETRALSHLTKDQARKVLIALQKMEGR